MKRRMTDRKLRLMPETLQSLDHAQGGAVWTRPGQATCDPCYPISYPRTSCPEDC